MIFCLFGICGFYLHSLYLILLIKALVDLFGRNLLKDRPYSQLIFLDFHQRSSVSIENWSLNSNFSLFHQLSDSDELSYRIWFLKNSNYIILIPLYLILEIKNWYFHIVSTHDFFLTSHCNINFPYCNFIFHHNFWSLTIYCYFY